MTKTILINKQNKIKDSYYKRVNLITVKNSIDQNVLIEEETYQNYLELQKYLATKNINIAIDSAYRSQTHQQKLYQEFCSKYGKEYADIIVAPVGTSEHHTGLAIDLTIKTATGFLDKNIEQEKYLNTYNEIHKVLHNFGFILRYPEGKENITRYPYEPWHIRYVGKFVAKIIYENDYTLEEYLKDYSAILLVNKEKNMTSFDVVNEISHLFGIKKVGHTGTLDPLAEGVLIVTIGKATKVVELLTATYKEYVATVKLGITTDTADITGQTIATSPVPVLDNLENVLASFQKTYLQEVPIYSAVKVNGKKLYEYARESQSVELPKKEVTIKKIELINKTSDTFTFKALVSKGCYIRSLITDIAESMGTCATMSALTRTKQGRVDISKTSTLAMIKSNNFKIYQIDEVLDLPVVLVDENLERKIITGQKIPNTFNVIDKVIFKTKNNKVLGIYQCQDKRLKVWKNFV